MHDLLILAVLDYKDLRFAAPPSSSESRAASRDEGLVM